MSDVRMLGAHHQYGLKAIRTPPKWLRGRIRAAYEFCLRVRRLTFMPPHQRGNLMETGALSSAFYGAEITSYDHCWGGEKTGSTNSLRSSIGLALMPKHKTRAQEILFTLFAKGHKVDPRQVIPYRILIALRRMIGRRPEWKSDLETVWQKREEETAALEARKADEASTESADDSDDDPADEASEEDDDDANDDRRRRGWAARGWGRRNAGGAVERDPNLDRRGEGPGRRILRAAWEISWKWIGPTRFADRTGVITDCMEVSAEEWAHRVREGIRHAQWAYAEVRRARGSNDMEGITRLGIDRAATLALWKHRRTSHHERGFLRTTITGGTLSGARLGRMHPKLYPGGLCWFCSTPSKPVKETVPHIHWECPHWKPVRAAHALDKARRKVRQLPGCLRDCGIMPQLFDARPFLDGWAPTDPALPRPGGAPRLLPARAREPDEAEAAEEEADGGAAPGAAGTPPPPQGILGPPEPKNEEARDEAGEARIGGRTIVFTDGAATNNQLDWARRAGYGAYWGPGNRLNITAPLYGTEQGNNAAELAAIAAALRRDPRPLQIRTDSDHAIQGILHRRTGWRAADWRPRPLATAHIRNSETWKEIDDLIRTRGEGHDEFVWVKGHATVAMVAAGAVTPFNRAGNDAADLLGTTGAALHAIPPDELQAAAARTELAVRMQRMFLQIAMSRAVQLKKIQKLAPEEQDDGPDGEDRPSQPEAVLTKASLYPWGFGNGLDLEPRPYLLKKNLRNKSPTRRLDPDTGIRTLPKRERRADDEFTVMLGATLWEAFVSWYDRLRWPPADVPRAAEGISWIELAVDFEVSTGIDLPPPYESYRRNRVLVDGFRYEPKADTKGGLKGTEAQLFLYRYASDALVQ
eukprot:gene7309-3957_t